MAGGVVAPVGSTEWGSYVCERFRFGAVSFPGYIPLCIGYGTPMNITPPEVPGSVPGAPDPGPVPVGEAPPQVEQHVVRSTRTSRTWTAMILFVVVLILLLVFVLQNGQRVTVSFLGADGHLPLAVAMLFAAAGGALLVAIPGVSRMVQLRRVARRHRIAENAPLASVNRDRSGRRWLSG